MKDLFTSHINTNAGQPALNPFAGFITEMRLAAAVIAELQHPESMRGRGAGLSVFAGPSG